MKLLDILKWGGHAAVVVAPEVLRAYNPMLGALLDQIIAAEAKHGPGNGATKKAMVMDSLPVLIRLVETLIGRDLVDDVAFATAVSKVVDDLVAVLNAVHTFQAVTVAKP